MDPVHAMNSVPPPFATPPALPPVAARSVWVTGLAWLAMGVGALLSPISLVSLLMLVVGSDGTASAKPADALLVVGGPPVLVLAGIGLWRRQRWAHRFLVSLLAAWLAYQAHLWWLGPSPGFTSRSPDGVTTTVLASGPRHSITGIVFGSAMLALLLSPRVRREFPASVCSKLRPSFPPPPVVSPAEPAALSPISLGPLTSTPPPARLNGLRALIVAVLLMLVLAGGMGWLVASGLAHGETYFPGKRASKNRVVSRSAEPVHFWISLGLYAALGAGAAGVAIWGAREGLRLKRTGRS